MDIILYNFAKRQNSTKEPNPVDATRTMVHDVQIKNETSFLSPTFILSPEALGSGFSPTKFNYCSVPYWQRHYFVKDWRWNPPYWELDLTVDALASFKYSIADTEAYIIRAASMFNGNVQDTLYAAQSDPVFTTVPVACAWYNVAPSGGCYVLGVINYQSSNRVGAASYYALTASQLGQVLNYLFGNNIYNDMAVDEISDGLFKAMFNPFQYIVSCTWFPFDTSRFGSITTDIKIGYWSTHINGIIVNGLAEITFVTATIPDHPQISRGVFLNRAPFTRLTLYIQPFGSIPIDTACLSNGNYLYCPVLVDHITGQATIRISTCTKSNLISRNVITERSGNLGVPIQLAQVLTDNLNTVTSIGGAIGSIFTGNIMGAVNGITSAIDSQMPKVSTSGSNGSFNAFIAEPVLTVEHYKLVDENNNEKGRPLCQIKRIGALSGFIQCADADHSFGCTDVERQIINNYLKNGFYYE